jgi:protein-S-isoprenylcysteine O-methyltransferase Ste14
MPLGSLFWRALTAFLLLPGVVAFAVPWLLRPAGVSFRVIGLVPLAIGVILLLWCVRDFYVAGRGSLAPWDPPKRLVVVGLYQYSRNPMYLAVLTILAAWALGFGSRTLWLYAASVALAFHLRVLLGEEPWLARTHGEAWESYRGRVPRWIGRVAPDSDG